MTVQELYEYTKKCGVSETCLENAKEAAKSADIQWPNEGSAGQ